METYKVTAGEFIEMHTDLRVVHDVLSAAGHESLSYWRDGNAPHHVDIGIFGAGDHRISVLDIFGGYSPLYIDKAVFTRPRTELETIALLLIDTNIATYLRQFLEGSLTPELAPSIRQFLAWLSCAPVGLHPAFALMESKATSSDFEAFATVTVKAVMTIAYMDRAYFQACGLVRVDEGGLDMLEREHGTRDLLALAQSEAIKVPKMDEDTTEHTFSILGMAALLETDFSKSQLRRKVEGLLQFMDRYKLLFSPVAIGAAFMHFLGLSGKFLSLSPMMTAASVTDKIDRAARDCALLELPALALAMSAPRILPLYLIATADADLAAIGRNVHFHSILSNTSGSWRRMAVRFDFDAVLNQVPADVRDRLGRSIEAWSSTKEWFSGGDRDLEKRTHDAADAVRAAIVARYD